MSLRDFLWDCRLSLELGGIRTGTGHILRRRFYRLLTRKHTPDSTLVAEREWDFLFVLDACRWDTFCKVWGEEVPFIHSPGSCTAEWSEENFMKGGNFGDTVVITSSPYMTPWFFESKGRQYPFGECINQFLEGWDEELGTVLPSTMTDAVRTALPRLSGKRVIIHFIQPHVPWVRFVLDRPEILGKFKTLQSWEILWFMVMSQEISLTEAKAAYEDNLSMVLDEIASLIKDLKGKIVITSDHGNLFGEYGLFSHPAGVRVPELTKVPWLELEGGVPQWLRRHS